MDLRRLSTTTRQGLSVVLTPFTSDEVDRVRELCQDPEIPRWTPIPSPYLQEHAEAFVHGHARAGWEEFERGAIDWVNPGPEVTWGVRVGEGTPLEGLWGAIGLKRHGESRLEIGWWLGADARGLGIIRAAVALLTELALDADGPIRASSVLWVALVGNHPSAHIAQRTGYEYTGAEVNDKGERLWTAIIRPGDSVAPRDDWPELTDAD